MAHDPCLFRHSAPHKATKELLLGICQHSLASDQSLIRLLKRVQFAANQRPIDEVNFTVDDLVRDVRDGVRLSRLMELLTERRDLLPNLVYHGERQTHQTNALGNLREKTKSRKTAKKNVQISDFRACRLTNRYTIQLLKTQLFSRCFVWTG
jgi:hypothetical protein